VTNLTTSPHQLGYSLIQQRNGGVDMFYVISAVIFGLLASFVQVGAEAEMLSGLWWAIGAPFWLLSGFIGSLLTEVFK
jgi:ABC-type multidrug transport system permease subunit